MSVISELSDLVSGKNHRFETFENRFSQIEKIVQTIDETTLKNSQEVNSLTDTIASILYMQRNGKLSTAIKSPARKISEKYLSKIISELKKKRNLYYSAEFSLDEVSGSFDNGSLNNGSLNNDDLNKSPSPVHDLQQIIEGKNNRYWNQRLEAAGNYIDSHLSNFFDFNFSIKAFDELTYTKKWLEKNSYLQNKIASDRYSTTSKEYNKLHNKINLLISKSNRYLKTFFTASKEKKDSPSLESDKTKVPVDNIPASYKAQTAQITSSTTVPSSPETATSQANLSRASVVAFTQYAPDSSLKKELPALDETPKVSSAQIVPITALHSIDDALTNQDVTSKNERDRTANRNNANSHSEQKPTYESDSITIPFKTTHSGAYKNLESGLSRISSYLRRMPAKVALFSMLIGLPLFGINKNLFTTSFAEQRKYEMIQDTLQSKDTLGILDTLDTIDPLQADSTKIISKDGLQFKITYDPKNDCHKMQNTNSLAVPDHDYELHSTRKDLAKTADRDTTLDFVASQLSKYALPHDNVLFIDMKSQRAYYCSSSSGSWTIGEQTLVSTGRNPGPKRRAGDNKTPVGVFHITQIQDSRDWVDPFDHEPRAYGPYFCRISAGSFDSSGRHNPNGRSSIGVHGTIHPEDLGSRASHGCIRMPNDIIQSLVENKYLQIGSTVIIQ